MSSQRLGITMHHLYFIALGGADPVSVTLGISPRPIDLAIRKTRRIGREAVLWFAAIGPRSRASAALGSLRSRMQCWPAQDGWYLVPVGDGRQFRRSFGSVVESYTHLDTKKSIQHVDLKEYSRRRGRADFTFTPRAARARTTK